MLLEYDWPEPTIEVEYLYEDYVNHTSYIEERVSDDLLYLLGEWISDIKFVQNFERSGFYDHLTQEVLVHASVDSTEKFREGLNSSIVVPKSPLIHEIGHALHDMHGLSLFGPDYFAIDNRDVENTNWKCGVFPSNQFIEEAIILWEAFRDEVFYPLRRYQERNISEFIAVSFEQWITNPTYIVHLQQPVAEFLDKWFGSDSTNSLIDFKCTCRMCMSETGNSVQLEELLMENKKDGLQAYRQQNSSGKIDC